jgi:hypothetical protein
LKKEVAVKFRAALSLGVAVLCLGVYMVLPRAGVLDAAQVADVAIDPDDIGGVVTGPRGPEAGVWVIAETTDLPTRLIKSVVTDDQGRYVVPDLPKASFDVWVRGYGLVDSPKVKASPGQRLSLKAVPAPTPQAAAQYFPAGYWYSLMQIPAENEFPGTGPEGNGIAPNMATQAHWKRSLSSLGCLSCHQLGNKATREIPAELGTFPNTKAAWDRRVQSGQAGAQMSAQLNAFGRDRVLAMFADWTDRIKAGEVPPTPPRPQGLERNIVVTQWDWADPKSYLHDVVSTDRRNPTVNANGPVYGALELSSDYVPVVDPVRHEATRIPMTVRDPGTQPASAPNMLAPSPYFGGETLWTSKTNVHNPMIDHKGRVWLTSRVRPNQNPAYCYDGSHPSSKVAPLKTSGRQLAMWDPATKTLTHISTCYGTHHLMFAEDANHTLWTSGASALGYLNTKMFDETGDEVKSQGWAPFVIDTNGNGRRDAFIGPNDPPDPTRDQLAGGSSYAVAPAADGTVWGSMLGFPGRIFRMVPGFDPANTALTEVYEPPFDNPAAPTKGYGPRGMDVDRNGVAWVPLASGHMASFDRRKCKGPLNGPTATGQHCPEGWTLYPEPLPQFKGVKASGSAEGSYYTWVDQFDTFGLGANTPFNTGNLSDGPLALKDGKWVILRVPYPLGFYTKWMDGRIDDANAGWKGRGLWATVSSRAPFHMEGGKGTTSKVAKFQLRPNPLAK